MAPGGDWSIMILGFYQKIGRKPTNFREKILSCVEPVTSIGVIYQKPPFKKVVNGNSRQLSLITQEVIVTPNLKAIEVKTTFKPKRHTIREDKSRRWRKGMKIQMVYRGKHYSVADHFNKEVPELGVCQNVQRITIHWRRPKFLAKKYGEAIPAFTLKVKNQFLYVTIDGKLIGHKTLKELAINDGFESIGDFLQHFRKTIKNWSLIIWSGDGYWFYVDIIGGLPEVHQTN